MLCRLDDVRQGHRRLGAASGYLAHDTAEGSKVRVYVEPNARFRLPRDPTVDVIMIGPGTGVAPFVRSSKSGPRLARRAGTGSSLAPGTSTPSSFTRLNGKTTSSAGS